MRNFALQVSAVLLLFASPALGQESRAEKISAYVGHYGEVLSFRKDDWVLSKPILLKNGIEVVRFHSSYGDTEKSFRIVPDAAFDRLENYTPMALAQLVVIPEGARGFTDIAALRAAKTKDLAAQGASFEIIGAPMPADQWPKGTFQVRVTSPYRLHQVYAQDGGKLFILTGGYDSADPDDHRFEVTFDDQLIGSLGDYFERLHRVAEAPEPERFDFSYSGSRWICLPLLSAGLLLLGALRRRRGARLAAYAALASAGSGLFLRTVSFFAILRFTDRGNPLTLVALSGLTLPAIAGLIIYRSRRLTPRLKIAVRLLTLCAVALLLALLGPAAQDILAGGQTLATGVSIWMFFVGLFLGACLGLTFDRQDIPASGRLSALAVLFTLFASAPAPARAQTRSLQDLAPKKDPIWANGTDALSRHFKNLIEDPRISAQKEKIEASRRVDRRTTRKEFENRAITNLRRRNEYFDIQRVEISGIIATDDTEKFAPGMFNLSLKPAHNNISATPPDPNENVFKKLWRNFSKGTDNDVKDIRDLLIDKSGRLTPRAREILEPLMDKNIHVNQIVAHSWGAVLLNNAIREGLINPPENIILVGVPDGDYSKWALLAQFTGTNVTIYDNNWDAARKFSAAHDFFENMDVAGSDTDYNNGNIDRGWVEWARTHKRLHGQTAIFNAYTGYTLPGFKNTAGHGREMYYATLKQLHILKETAAQLAQDQTDEVQRDASDLREEDIQREIARMRQATRKWEDEQPPIRAIPAPPPVYAVPDPAYGSRQDPGAEDVRNAAEVMRQAARKGCATGFTLTTNHERHDFLTSFTYYADYARSYGMGVDDLYVGLSPCEHDLLSELLANHMYMSENSSYPAAGITHRVYGRYHAGRWNVQRPNQGPERPQRHAPDVPTPGTPAWDQGG
jgi:hypothetical protein